MRDRDSWISVDDDAPARTPTSGTFVKWDEIGREVIGCYCGISAGKFGPVGTVETEHGRVFFSLPTDLDRQLRKVAVEDEVRIRYLASEPTRSGGTFKRFGVDHRKATPALEDDATLEPAPVPPRRPERAKSMPW